MMDSDQDLSEVHDVIDFDLQVKTTIILRHFLQCPLCLEVLEADDLSFFPCTCCYQVSNLNSYSYLKFLLNNFIV